MSRNLIIASAVVFVAVAAIVFVLVSQFLDGDANDAGNGVANGQTAELGESIYRQQCAGCHTIDGSDSVGPTLEGLYGSEVEMDDGSIVLVDEDHLYQAITDPRATTREGFPDVMPSFDNLSEDEVDGLVAFIQSLE